MASRNPYTPASYRRENRLAGAKTRFWRVCAAGATEVMSQTGAKRCSRCGENGVFGQLSAEFEDAGQVVELVPAVPRRGSPAVA